MKNLILTLIFFASPALAENDVCAELGRLAENSMNARLSGVPFSSVFAHLKEEMQDLEGEIRSVQELARAPQDARHTGEQIAFKLATEVYETQRSSDDKDKNIFALDFRNKVEIECYAEVNKAINP